MLIVHVVGARPNFMKVAPVFQALAHYPAGQQQIVHTGQHYDANMSDIFFQQLGLPRPDINLGIGSGSHAVQTAQVMIKFEEVVMAYRPDMVLVYGDVNSTVAAALVCAKLDIPVGHVEAGLRSFDRTMPEEINRLLTDQIADLLFTPSTDGDENLKREGIDPAKIHFVGNVMIDTLIRLLPQAQTLWPALQQRWSLGKFGLVTLHRPSNVDAPAMLAKILAALNELGQQLPLLFPIHPRTRQRIVAHQLQALTEHLLLTEPIGYLEFLALQSQAALVITDSGGIQEETTFLGVPCLTVRENTERPVTINLGTNKLVGQDMGRLLAEANQLVSGQIKISSPPPLWDGKAGERIAKIVISS